MRDIKFRGQLIDNKGWVYGYLVVDPNNNYRIYQQPFEGASSNTYFFVDYKTVGQYTGLKDKNGKGIYEGDILTGYRKGSNSDIRYTGFIKWQTEQAGWIIECGKYVMEILSLAMSGDGINTNLDTFEVIGNIYQNPELLESVQK